MTVMPTPVRRLIKIVTLRTLKWRRALLMPICRVPAACVARYENSAEWAALSPVFEADWRRRPAHTGVQYSDGHWIVLRFAVLARYFGYVQGYLYLLLPLQHVLQSRELTLHAMLAVVGATHCYSPIGLELGFFRHRKAVVAEVMRRATQRYPRARARLVGVRLRRRRHRSCIKQA